MRAWQTIDRVATPEGELVLRQRGERDYLILIDGRVLMSSTAFRSEVFLAEAACGLLAGRPAPRVLIGGLGMGLTLRLPLAARRSITADSPRALPPSGRPGRAMYTAWRRPPWPLRLRRKSKPARRKRDSKRWSGSSPHTAKTPSGRNAARLRRSASGP